MFTSYWSEAAHPCRRGVEGTVIISETKNKRCVTSCVSRSQRVGVAAQFATGREGHRRRRRCRARRNVHNGDVSAEDV